MTSAALHSTPIPLQPTHETLAAVVHDLKLPLSHIKGFVSSLRRDDLDWDQANRQEFLADLEHEVDRLAQMVDELMRSSTRGSRKHREKNRAPTDPAAIVNDAVQRSQSLLGNRPMRVEVAPRLPWVYVDADHIERLLLNLLQNAVKYSPKRTPICISARMHGDDELELAVDNDGPSIPLEDQDRLFEPFFRTGAVTESSVPGHGLGLAICQSIALAHGGRMAVTNRRRGSRFSVFLPVQMEAASATVSTECWRSISHDSSKHFCGGRRSSDAQAAIKQPQGQRLRGTLGS